MVGEFGEHLGPVGAYLPVSMTEVTPIDLQRAAAARLERAGYTAAWSNEVVGGKDVLVQLSLLLSATDRMAFGTGIANIWSRAPQTMHAAAAQLAEAYPGRLALGIGVGYPQQAEAVGREFGKPLATMRDYLAHMDGRTWPPSPDARYPRLIGALGTKMLALGSELADGVVTAGLPPAFTRLARSTLGPDKVIVIALPVVLEPDLETALVAARQVVATNAGRGSFRASVAAAGLAGVEGDRLVDAIVGYGGAESIAAKVWEHHVAGADHVVLMPGFDVDIGAGVDQLVDLAPALIGS